MSKRIAPSERMEKEFSEKVLVSEAPFSTFMKRAAQLTLQRAVEQEVDEFLGRARYERTGEAQPGHRNGYETKPLHSAEGTLEIEVPQLRGTLEPFESVWLRAIGKRSDRLMELIPLVYVKGMSHRDIEAALVEALGVEQTGRTVVRQVCQKLRGKFDQWQDRDLSMYNIEYLFLDGIYLKLRPEDKRAVAILCAYGITEKGKKVLLHLAVGDKESTACWEAFLEDIKARGLNEPLLTVLDGNSGVRRAVKNKLPGSLIQRCQVHKMRNIINKLPHAARATLKKLIYKAFTAKTHAGGKKAAEKIIAEYRDMFPEAMKCLEKDLEECLTVLKFPYLHRRMIRTTNILERLFGEGKRRTKVIPRFWSETSGMSLVFAVLLDASEGWRGVKMPDHIRSRLLVMRTDPDRYWKDPELEKIAA
jgi:putative transposase